MRSIRLLRLVAVATGALLLSACDASAPTLSPPGCAADPAPTARTPTAPGSDWTFLGLQGEGIGRVSALAVAPDDPDLLLAGTAADFSSGIPGRLFRSTDGGLAWTEVLGTGAFGGGFTEVSFDPHVPGRAFALPYNLLVSEDGGQTWDQTGEGITVSPDERVISLAFDLVNPGVMYVGTGGFFGGDLYKSTDGGQTFVGLGGGAECSDDPFLSECRLLSGVGVIAVDPEYPQTLYVGVDASLVMRSLDAGATWEILNEDVDGLPEALLLSRYTPNTLYVTVDSGILDNPPVLQSTDLGQTWTLFAEGLPDSLAAGRLVQDSVLGTLYVLASYREEGSLWRRVPGGAAWEEFAVEDEPLHLRGALTLTPERVLYVGGDGLWSRPLPMETGTEEGPCQP